MGVTEAVARFVVGSRFAGIPRGVIGAGKNHLLDGVGVMLAGSQEEGSRILQGHLRWLGGNAAATVLGTRLRAPGPHAALANGAAGHAMDYDDTQLTTAKESTYGLLTHPTVPVLAAALAVGEIIGASGRRLLHAYILGVEVACRVADAIAPRHYRSGFHSTATMGGFGAAAAAGKLLGLNPDRMRRALGLAASMAGGLRENFGTMTKPYHAGRAAESGLRAAYLARAGFTAAADILEAPRGFYAAMAGGFDEGKIVDSLGRPFFLLEPGIAIKPYPSGSLSHPAQDVILDMARTHDLRAGDIESISVGTNADIPNALIHDSPRTALEAKFSIPFCMAIAILERGAGIAQFTDRKVRDPRTMALMRRVRLYVHPELDALGRDHARALVQVRLKDGRVLAGQADVARGHPAKPMTREELEAKFRECAALAIPGRNADRAIALLGDIEKQPSLRPLLRILAAPGRRDRRIAG